jgi:Mn-dependent DtxR family transcriptional regulator
VGCSKADAIRDAIQHYAEYVRGLEVVAYRDVNKKQVKKEVQEYLKGKERVTTDEISDALRIDMSLVNEALLELWQEGWVEPDER